MSKQNVQVAIQVKSISETFASWNDLALVNWVANKQTHWSEAFSVLAHRYNSWVFKRCLFRLGNFHDAEDAAQDVVMKVYTHLYQLKDRGQFKAWLRTIVDNYCNTLAVRRARYGSSDHLEQMIESEEASALFTAHDEYAEKDLTQRAMSRLPVTTRQVLDLRFYGDHSLEEIANTLSLTLSATKARLYRGIEQFKQQYYKLESATL